MGPSSLIEWLIYSLLVVSLPQLAHCRVHGFHVGLITILSSALGMRTVLYHQHDERQKQNKLLILDVGNGRTWFVSCKPLLLVPTHSVYSGNTHSFVRRINLITPSQLMMSSSWTSHRPGSIYKEGFARPLGLTAPSERALNWKALFTPSQLG